MEQSPSEPASWRRYYIGATIGAALLLVIVISSYFLVSSGKTSHRCELSKTVPDVQALLNRAKNVPSAEKTDLANMVGYLFVYGEGFLPVILTEFIKGGERLSFISECATFSLIYRLVGNSTRIDLTGMNLQLDPLVKNGHECELPQSTELVIPMESVFSCRSPKSLVCRYGDSNRYMNLVAELVLESLEFELNGNPAAMKEGRFDKPLLDYSCNIVP